jgi:hypothetical protein
MSCALKCLSIVSAAIVILLPAFAAHAQGTAADELIVHTTPADLSAAQNAASGDRHAYPARTAAGVAFRARQAASQSDSNRDSGSAHARGPFLQYAGDVSTLGGRVIKDAESHAIYLQMQPGADCTLATCWGEPERYLRDLGASEFIHLVDQYVGLTGQNRYTVGFHARVIYSPQATPLTDVDIQAFVHAVAAQTGATGYRHIYHVFLPPGQDECIDATYTGCYSPDNPATFYYCAYHNYAEFSDIGHVLYTVHPYADVPGCQLAPGTPNGQLVDSVASIVSHEQFETITDPDDTGWKNVDGSNLGNQEIADECVFFALPGQGVYFDVPAFLIGAHRYAVQLIYSNEQHACSSAPSRGHP